MSTRATRSQFGCRASMPGRRGTRAAYTVSQASSTSAGAADRTRTSSVPAGRARVTRLVSISALIRNVAVPYPKRP